MEEEKKESSARPSAASQGSSAKQKKRKKKSTTELEGQGGSKDDGAATASAQQGRSSSQAGSAQHQSHRQQQQQQQPRKSRQRDRNQQSQPQPQPQPQQQREEEVVEKGPAVGTKTEQEQHTPKKDRPLTKGEEIEREREEMRKEQEKLARKVNKYWQGRPPEEWAQEQKLVTMEEQQRGYVKRRGAKLREQQQRREAVGRQLLARSQREEGDKEEEAPHMQQQSAEPKQLQEAHKQEMSMQQPKTCMTADAHEDIITDAVFSFDGTRLATASVDGRINIFDLTAENRWALAPKRPELTGAVSSLAWADPYFGQILVCGTHRGRVAVFHEEPGQDLRQGQMNWVKRTDLTGPHAVTHICFAPRHMGLRLAICYLNGRVRIFDCSNPFDDASSWQVTSSYHASGERPVMSWCPTRSWDSMLAIATYEGAHGLRIFRYNEEHEALVRLLTVSADDNFTHVAFAPNMGRTYLMLAAALQTGAVRVYRIDRDRDEEDVTRRYSVSTIFDEHLHDGEASRVSWDVTGTILTSAGQDGRFPVFRLAGKEKWIPVETGTVPFRRNLGH